MVVAAGAGSATVAGLAGGVVAIGAAGGSTFGEHAAKSAKPAKGVISTKRLRVVCMFIWIPCPVWVLQLGVSRCHGAQRDGA